MAKPTKKAATKKFVRHHAVVTYLREQDYAKVRSLARGLRLSVSAYVQGVLLRNAGILKDAA
jgi:hypothetical protein